MNRKAQMLSSHNTILGLFQVKHIYPEVSDQHNVQKKRKNQRGETGKRKNYPPVTTLLLHISWEKEGTGEDEWQTNGWRCEAHCVALIGFEWAVIEQKNTVQGETLCIHAHDIHTHTCKHKFSSLEQKQNVLWKKIRFRLVLNKVHSPLISADYFSVLCSKRWKDWVLKT